MPDTLPFGKEAKPEYPVIPPRPKLSRGQVIFLVIRQGMLCGCGCGDMLDPFNCIDEHLHARQDGGSDDISNRALWNRTCTLPKTARDKGAIAKGKRIRGETRNRPKRKIRGRSEFPPARGFSKAPQRRA